jgi:cytochrome c peroxidase
MIAVLFIAALLAIPLELDLYMPVDHTLSCASCHNPARAFSTARPHSVGVFGRQGRRNVPALINRGYGRAFFWDARITSLEEQVLKPLQDPNEMDLTLPEAAARVELPVEDISRALASYVRSILSGNSPFDRFINGDRKALSAEQQAGLQVCRGKGNCTACHVGPNFSDERLHNTGIAWQPSGGPGQEGRYLDDGRFAVTGKEADRGLFIDADAARSGPHLALHARREHGDTRGRRHLLQRRRAAQPQSRCRDSPARAHR